MKYLSSVEDVKGVITQKINQLDRHNANTIQLFLDKVLTDGELVIDLLDCTEDDRISRTTSRDGLRYEAHNFLVGYLDTEERKDYFLLQDVRLLKDLELAKV